MKPAAYDLTSTGCLARILENLSVAQINRAIDFQREHPRMKLGEALVRLGFMSETGLRVLLQKQLDLRAGRASPRDIDRIVAFAERATELHGEEIANAVRKVGKRL